MTMVAVLGVILNRSIPNVLSWGPSSRYVDLHLKLYIIQATWRAPTEQLLKRGRFLVSAVCSVASQQLESSTWCDLTLSKPIPAVAWPKIKDFHEAHKAGTGNLQTLNPSQSPHRNLHGNITALNLHLSP